MSSQAITQDETENSLHLVIVGHVDHGKSTLIGRLYYDTNSLPAEKYEEIKKISEEMGKEMEFAFIMDHLQEERQRGITIDIAHSFFKTEKRKYVIIDAPGHREFLKNMITGSSQAEAALLLLDINEGIKDQTKRHCYILSLFGIKQVAVVVNKMDMVDYSEKRFNKIKDEISDLLGQMGMRASYIIPISAKLGENLAKKSEKLKWFDGPTVLEALDKFKTLEIENKELRFPVQDIYEHDGKSIAVGRVEAGVLRKNQEVFVLPEKEKCTVKKVKKFGEDDLVEAAMGECVGIEIDGKPLSRGQVLTDKASATITKSIHANIFWMVDESYKVGMPVLFRCATQEAACKIEKIYKRFDPANADAVEKDATQIDSSEVAEVEITLAKNVVIDNFAEIPELGRFILESNGHTLAGGIIV